MRVVKSIKELKGNKYYKINETYSVFVNNIYKIRYEELNNVFFNGIKLDKYHNEYFENFWFNYDKRLIFASGLLNLKTDKLIVYYMDLWSRFTKKGEYNKDMVDRLFNTFTGLKTNNRFFNISKQISQNEFLITQK